jgi:hypothetical protein
MARKTPTYRPISITIWDDIRFHGLSEDAKLLWLFLLTSSECPIPGILIAGETTVSERIGWPVDRVRSVFAELVAKHINVLWEGRVVWCVNGLKHQPVCNPNQLKSIATAFRNVPDVSFKHALWRALREACKSWSVMFGDFFVEPSRVVAASVSPTAQIELPTLSSTNRYQPQIALPTLSSINRYPLDPGVLEQEQHQDLELQSLRSSSVSEPATTAGRDLDPRAHPAPTQAYASRVDPGAIEVLQQFMAGKMPTKGGAN